MKQKIVLFVVLMTMMIGSVNAGYTEVADDGTPYTEGWVNTDNVIDINWNTYSYFDNGFGLGAVLRKDYPDLDSSKIYVYRVKHNTSGTIETTDYTIPLSCYNSPTTYIFTIFDYVGTKNTGVWCYDLDGDATELLLFEDRPYSNLYETQLYEYTPSPPQKHIGFKGKGKHKGWFKFK